MHADGLLFPRPADGKRITRGQIEWRLPAYRNIISVLQNPLYAGAYAYGRSEHRTTIVDGRAVKKYGHARPLEEWTVLLRDHHEGYVTWEQYKYNQDRIQKNAYSKPAGDAKSARGGRALLSSLLRCRRCGRMLRVAYSGHCGLPRYSCNIGNSMHGLRPCINFGATRPDLVVARLLLDVVQPLAIEAAIVAEQQASHRDDERKRALELERQQTDYEVQLARRRYESVDPSPRTTARLRGSSRGCTRRAGDGAGSCVFTFVRVRSRGCMERRERDDEREAATCARADPRDRRRRR